MRGGEHCFQIHRHQVSPLFEGCIREEVVLVDSRVIHENIEGTVLYDGAMSYHQVGYIKFQPLRTEFPGQLPSHCRILVAKRDLRTLRDKPTHNRRANTFGSSRDEHTAAWNFELGGHASAAIEMRGALLDDGGKAFTHI